MNQLSYHKIKCSSPWTGHIILYIIISEWFSNMLKHRNFIQFHHYKYKPPHKSQTYPICGAMKSQVNENQGFPQKKAASGWSKNSRGSGRSPKSGAGVGETKQPRDFKQYQTYNWLVVSNMFYTFFIFPSYMGCHPSHWLSYFSEGLKPPSSINMVN